MNCRHSAMAAAIAACLMSSSAIADDIHVAARNGNLEEVQALIESGVDLSERDRAVGAALHWAAARGHVEVARELIEAGADPNQEANAPDLLTPLHLASTSGHLALVELLVESGARLDAGEGAVGTPLHRAAQADRADVVVFLLDAGADPAARTTDGSYAIYPLHLAAAAGATNALSALLNHGFPVDAANDRTGVTALHMAVFQTQPEAASLLLAAGANPHAMSTNLDTPAALAEHSSGMEEIFAAAGIE